MTINSIFIKLLLRNKIYWANRLNLHSKIVIKSFYKNSESSLLSSMRSINALLDLGVKYNLQGVSIWNITIYNPQLWLIINSQYEIMKF